MFWGSRVGSCASQLQAACRGRRWPSRTPRGFARLPVCASCQVAGRANRLWRLVCVVCARCSAR
eukprot:7959680-Lingulodinium_polyedra.AAC.1